MRYFIAILLFFGGNYCSAQTTGNANVELTLPSVALLAMSPNNSQLNLSFASPSVAGTALGNTTTDNSKWINFTSAVAPGITRKVTVQIISGGLPSGILLKLQTANVAGGAGARGSAVSSIYVISTATNIINNIGGAYTGVGSGNGYNLTYSLEIQDFSQLRSGSNILTIAYTISDN